MYGFLATLTPTQRSLALAYRGKEEDLFEVPALDDDSDLMDNTRVDLSNRLGQLDDPMYEHGDDEDLIDISEMELANSDYSEWLEIDEYDYE